MALCYFYDHSAPAPGPRLNIKTVFPMYGGSHVNKIRRSRVPILVRWHLLLRLSPCVRLIKKTSSYQNRNSHQNDKTVSRMSNIYNANPVPVTTVLILRRRSGAHFNMMTFFTGVWFPLLEIRESRGCLILVRGINLLVEHIQEDQGTFYIFMKCCETNCYRRYIFLKIYVYEVILFWIVCQLTSI